MAALRIIFCCCSTCPGRIANIGAVWSSEIDASSAVNSGVSCCGSICLDGSVKMGGTTTLSLISAAALWDEGSKKFLQFHVIIANERLLIYILLRRKNLALISEPGISSLCEYPIRANSCPEAIHHISSHVISHANMMACSVA